MGVYRAVKADNQSVVLVHEPETTQSHTIEIRNPQASWTPRIEEGKRYTVSISVTEIPVSQSEAKVAPLPNTVENELRVVQGRTEQATGPVSGVVVEAEAETEPEANKE